MAQFSNTSDLFSLLHDLLEEDGAENQRASERRDYRCVQLVAPYDGQTQPEEDAFYGVRCHDLSPQGFSFLSDEKPVYSELIVALGKGPYIHVIAAVARVSKKRASDGRYLVGCHFERRLD